MIGDSEVPVRRGRSLFSIIGMIVVTITLVVLIYFAYVGWVKKGKPIPEVDVKTDAMNTPAVRTSAATAVPSRA